MSIVNRNWLDPDEQWLDGFRYRLPFFSGPMCNYPVSGGGSVVNDIPLQVILSGGTKGSGERSQGYPAAYVFGEIGSNWKKIAITTDDGITQCEIEVANWDDSNELAQLFFLCPEIGNEDADGNRLSQKFYLYFDNEASDNDSYVGDYTDTMLMQTIWADYEVVLHCQQTPTQDSGGDIKDSSGNNRNWTWRGDDSNPTSEFTEERLGDGATQAYEIEAGNPNRITGGGGGGFASTFLGISELAVMCMVRVETVAAGDFVLDFSDDGNAERKFRIQITGTDPYYFIFQQWDDADANIGPVTSSVALATNDQKIIHAFYNGGSGLGDTAIWVGLTEDQGTPSGNTINSTDNDTNPITWGARSDNNNHFDGRIGEMRLGLDGSLFTDSYIAINYFSLTNTLFNWMEMEEKPAAPPKYRLPIHIKPDNVDSDLYDYQVKIFLGSSVGDDGQDATALFDEIVGSGDNWRRMRLTDQDGLTMLPLECQYWNGTTKRAVFHTKVPFIDSVEGRHLFLYYDIDLPFCGETIQTGHRGMAIIYGDRTRWTWHPFKRKADYPAVHPLEQMYQSFRKADGSQTRDTGTYDDIDDNDFGFDSTFGPYVDVGDGEGMRFGEDGWMEGAIGQQFSVEVLVRFPVELSQQQYLLTKRDGVTPFQGWEMHFDPNLDTVRFNIDIGANASVVRTTTTDVDDNTVRQFVMTYDGSDAVAGFKMYMNGVLDRTIDVDNFPLGGTYQSDIEMCIGTRGTSLQQSPTRFQIFEARLYSRHEISADFIKANYYNFSDSLLRFDQEEAYADLAETAFVEFAAIPAFWVGFPTVFILPTAENLKWVTGTHVAVVGGRRVFIGEADGKKPKVLTTEGGAPQLT